MVFPLTDPLIPLTWSEPHDPGRSSLLKDVDKTRTRTGDCCRMDEAIWRMEDTHLSVKLPGVKSWAHHTQVKTTHLLHKPHNLCWRDHGLPSLLSTWNGFCKTRQKMLSTTCPSFILYVEFSLWNFTWDVGRSPQMVSESLQPLELLQVIVGSVTWTPFSVWHRYPFFCTLHNFPNDPNFWFKKSHITMSEYIW